MTHQAYAAVKPNYEMVPPRDRMNFAFHATALLDSNSPYRTVWPFKNWLAMIHAMMVVPSVLRMLLAGGLLSVIGATTAFAGAPDIYNPANHQLTIPSIVIGSVTYNDLVVTVSSVLHAPYGNAGSNIGDTYTASNQQLRIAEVMVGSTTYWNPVVLVSGLVSIASISGADGYDGTNLKLPAVQLIGGNLYTNVVVAVSAADIVSVGGGMPTVDQNQYNPANLNQLTIPIIQVGTNIYTNVVVTVNGNQLISVGGSLGGASENLYSFAGPNASPPDDSSPLAALILGSDTAFYGTTGNGGAQFQGTVFRITQAGAYSLLYSFGTTDGDGSTPKAPLIEGTDGNFYGTTSAGGDSNRGVAFRISPTGTYTRLHSFGAPGSHDGASPNGLVEGSDNNLYATTTLGGTNNLGAIVQITPAGVATLVYSFGTNGNTDGSFPEAALVQGSTDHIFYGTTSSGGADGKGTVFSFTLGGVETVLYSFGAAGDRDGAVPNAVLFQGTDGNYYGTTYIGGAYNRGTVFSVTPQGSETQLYAFHGDGGLGGSLDGAYPLNGVIQGSNGEFFGTTNNGGAFNVGTVFRVVPGGPESLVYSFSGAAVLAGSQDGAYPEGVVQAANDALYGVAYGGGANFQGTVFGISSETVD
jgi:uncharacterized repeat protein (TIGR03803 family)